MRMVRLFFFFFMVAHWVGCFWFLLAKTKHYDTYAAEKQCDLVDNENFVS